MNDDITLAAPWHCLCASKVKLADFCMIFVVADRDSVAP